MKLSKNEKIENLKQSVRDYLNTEALSRGYDNINSIGKYLGYSNKYKTEAELLGKWSAEVWSKAYEELEKDNAIDLTEIEFLELLPKIT